MSLQTLQAARKAENLNQWREAARLWRSIGHELDAVACELIATSNEAGDAYRAEVLRVAGEEPDRFDNPHAWVKWYDTMHSVYQQQFPQ